MAKKISTDQSIAISGVDSSTVETAKLNNSKALSSAFETLTETVLLNINNENVEFELVKISYTAIDTDTFVLAENERSQEFLTALNLKDLIDNIKLKGQTFPALGRKRIIDNETKIEVIDGSRRRSACKYAERDFYIYVSKDNSFSQTDVEQISIDANLHRPISILEKGYKYKKLLETRKCKNNKEIAEYDSTSTASVSYALKVAEIPRWLIDFFPDPTELGRRILSKVHTCYFNLNPEDEPYLKEQLNETRKLFILGSEQSSSSQNQMIFKAIESICSSADKKSPNGATQKARETNINYKLNMTAKGLKLEFLDVTDEQSKLIYEALEILGISKADK